MLNAAARNGSHAVVGRLAVQVLTIAVLAGAAQAQSVCPAPSQRVDPTYTPNIHGLMQAVRNQVVQPDGTVDFPTLSSGDPFNPACHAIPMADPTVLKIGQWYYCTGTSRNCQQANFPIYKSKDLKYWSFHMFAFDDALRSGGALAIHGRNFSQMWAPELVHDADNRVYLSFTAVETFAGQAESARTLLLASMTTNQFRNAASNSAFHFAAEYANEPLYYGYFANNAVPPASPPAQGETDGGVSVGHAIATSINMEHFGQPGHPAVAEGGVANDPEYRFANITGVSNNLINNHYANTRMELDGFPYVDPTDNRRWMLYTWRERHATDMPGRLFDGNMVAAFPMIDARLMDASPSAQMVPLAYRYSPSFGPLRSGLLADVHACHPPQAPQADALSCSGTPNGGSLLNGMSGQWASRMGLGFHGDCNSKYGVAEGPAAFVQNGVTYVLYSRNAWNSPAYCITYRYAFGSLADAVSPNGWRDKTTPEYDLVSSYPRRGNPDASGFGHGETFIGPLGRRYLVFHAKRAGQCEDERFVQFKELTITDPEPAGGGSLYSGTEEDEPGKQPEDEIGWPEVDSPPPPGGPILPLGPTGAEDAGDITIYLIPRDCPADFNQDGQPTQQDIFDFLDVWFNGDVDADFNADGLVTQQDIFDFLNAYFAGGCD